MNRKKITRALVSVYDKTGLVDLGKNLETNAPDKIRMNPTLTTRSGFNFAIASINWASQTERSSNIGKNLVAIPAALARSSA